MNKLILQNGGVVQFKGELIGNDIKTVSDIDFLIDFAEAMEEIKESNDKRLKAIGAVFSHLIDKKGAVVLTDKISALLDEVVASTKVPSFTDGKRDKIKKPKNSKIKAK